MGELLGQPVIVDNRTGANSNVGAEVVARAPPDGWWIMMRLLVGATRSMVWRSWLAATEAPTCRGLDVYIVGGANSGAQIAAELALAAADARKAPPTAADDPMLVFDLTDQVRETIQQTLYRLLMERTSVFGRGTSAD